MADGLDRAAQWRDSRVVSAYVFGDLLDGVGDLECVQLVFMVDEAPDDVPWMSRPRRLEALASMVRFDKLPLAWWWRSAVWPVWNHRIIGAVRFWAVELGRDQKVFDALTAGDDDQLTIECPADRSQLEAQLIVERDTARRHLAHAVEQFYNRDWRRQHSGEGIHAEDHLWCASAAFLELDDALSRSTDR